MKYSKNYSITKLTRNRVYWYVIFRDYKTNVRLNKKSVETLRKELGDYSTTPVLDKNEAIAIVDKYLASINEVKDTGNILNARSYISNFYDYSISQYLQRQIALNNIKIGKDYAYTRKCMLDKYVVPKINESKQLSDIKMFDIENIQMRIINEDSLKAGTVNMIMHSLIFSLKEAQRLGLTNHIITTIDNIKEAKIEERGIFTKEEVKALLSFFKQNNNWRMECAIMLSLATGMRSGEIRALEAINVHDNYIDVLHTLADKAGKKVPKGRRERKVPCPEVITRTLRKYSINGEGLIFYNKNNHKASVETHYFTYNLNKAMEAINISKIEKNKRKLCFHTFRHMANTMLQGSVDENTLRMTIGHTTNAMTRRYTHLTKEKMNQVVKAQISNIESIIGQ